MSISVRTLQLLVDAGLSGEALMRVVRSIEADHLPAPPTTDAERQARYRGRLGMAPREWAILAAQIKERDNYKCTYCGAIDVPLHVDHVIPLIQGGTNDPSNLATACRECNCGKSGLTVEQWRARK